jgi:hypothetical protein
VSALPWSAEEHADALALSWPEFQEKYGNRRTWQAYTRRRQYLAKGDIPIVHPAEEREKELVTVLSDKKTGSFSWRRANEWIKDGQEIKKEASQSQDYAHFTINKDRIRVITISDTHIGSWGTDHNLLERITDEILNTPNLYVILAGDLVHMAIKLRGVMEVSDNLLSPGLQTAYFISWLQELIDRILFGGWDNHAVIRQEDASGTSQIADIMKDRIVYFNGIGHADLTVGRQTYKIAMSHRFRGRSELNPVYGPHRYLTREGTDRDIAIAGDSHVPGIMHFMFGGSQRLAINTGSIQTNSGYAKRFFSLETYPVFPIFALDGNDKIMSAFWNLAEMRSIMGE